MTGGRAETRRQKNEIAGRLLTAWLAVPDLRLGQLIFNATGGRDIFNDEDYPLIESVEKFITDITGIEA